MTETRAVYKGKGYKARRQEGNRYLIYSDTPIEGFEKYEKNGSINYFKIVHLSELDSVYKVRKKYIYNEKKYDYFEEDGEIILNTTDQILPHSIPGSYLPGQGEYWIPVERNEEKFTVEIIPIYPKEELPKDRSDVKIALSGLSGAKTYPKVMHRKVLCETPSIGLI